MTNCTNNFRFSSHFANLKFSRWASWRGSWSEGENLLQSYFNWGKLVSFGSLFIFHF